MRHRPHHSLPSGPTCASDLKCICRKISVCVKYAHDVTATNEQVRAAFCRISSDPKDKREGVDRQREDTAILCEMKGWQVEGVYIDNDRQRANGKDRPEWERLLADIRAGKIDAVAAWDQDRVNRMMEDFVPTRSCSSTTASCWPPPTTVTSTFRRQFGVLTATIKTAVCEHEISMMKIRMRRAAKQKAERGEPKWKRAFGYLGGDCQPDPQTAPLVKAGVRGHAPGSSLGDVARTFNDADAYGLTGRPWTQSTVSLFLRKPRKPGCAPTTARRSARHLAGLGGRIDLARSAIGARRAGAGTGSKTVRRHLLTGVLQCGNAGTTWSASGRGRATSAYAWSAAVGCPSRPSIVEPLLYNVVRAAVWRCRTRIDCRAPNCTTRPRPKGAAHERRTRGVRTYALQHAGQQVPAHTLPGPVHGQARGARRPGCAPGLSRSANAGQVPVPTISPLWARNPALSGLRRNSDTVDCIHVSSEAVCASVIKHSGDVTK